jgi:superfamily I DNA/RNA helicase
MLETAIPWAIDAFKNSHDLCPEMIDFDDMIYAPLAYGMRLFRNDWVLMDEDQDANPARRELARRMLKSNGRFMGVGDKHQAIYGFTGAGNDSIAKIVAEFNCQQLPLTVTYRCPRAVVAYVQQWVKHIQAHPDASEGSVAPVATDPKVNKPWYVQCPPDAADAILCRYTKPLIQTAYGMIKHGMACKVEGRDIGKGLIALAKRWKVRTIDALDARLVKYQTREVAKARTARNEKREQDVLDRVDTLRIFMQRCLDNGNTSVECVVQEIDNLFADDVAGVTTLSTGHKAKGREWDRVYWLQHADRQNHQAWMDQQETNIKYVIGTRAKRELILVPEIKQ